MEEKAQDRQKLLRVPTSKATGAGTLAAAGMSGDEFLKLVRQRERYDWLADKVERWSGVYSVPELMAKIRETPTMPGQRQKALVALSLNADLSARAALEELDAARFGERFELLHQIALGQWQSRYRASRGDMAE